MSSRAFFEPLESRQMFSVSLVNGIVRVHGTPMNDTIAVSQDSTRVRVNDNGTVTLFAAASVKRVVVNAYEGNDQIIGRSNLMKPLTAA